MPDISAGTTSRLVSSLVEREVKLAVPSEFRLPADCWLSKDIRAEAASCVVRDTVYFDTPDLRLARRHISLRHREGEGWTLKLLDKAEGPLIARRECVFDGPGDHPPALALDTVLALTGRAEVGPVTTLNAQRTKVRLVNPSGEAIAEMVDDTVAPAGDQRPSFREVEVELAPDTPETILGPVLDSLERLGARPRQPVSKLMRALGMPLFEERSQLGKVERLVATPLIHAFDELLHNDPGIRLNLDVEYVHHARVAVRRLRSHLRAFRKQLEPAWSGPLDSELRWLGRALGAVRDAQVLAARMTDDAAGLGLSNDSGACALLGRLSDEADHKYRELLIVLRSDRYLDLVEQLRAQLPHPNLRPEAPALGARKLIRSPWAKLRRAVKALPSEPADSELHGVRIRAKRCRYAAEAAGKDGGHRASTLAAACTNLQDVLGEYQDTMVARRWLSARAPQLTSAEAFVAGQLFGVERDKGATSRAAWHAAWREVNDKDFRRWLS